MLQVDPLGDLLDHLTRFLDVSGHAIIEIFSPHRVPPLKSTSRCARCGRNRTTSDRFGSTIPSVGSSEFRDVGARELLPTQRAHARSTYGDASVDARVKADEWGRLVFL